jgi:hypothetical protein
MKCAQCRKYPAKVLYEIFERMTYWTARYGDKTGEHDVQVTTTDVVPLCEGCQKQASRMRTGPKDDKRHIGKILGRIPAK